MTPNSQFLDGVHKAIPDKAAKILVVRERTRFPLPPLGRGRRKHPLQ